MNCGEKYCFTSRLSSWYFLCEILRNVTVSFGEMMATFEWCLSQQPVSLSSCCYIKPIDHPVMTIEERNLCCYFWFCYNVACLHWYKGIACTEALFSHSLDLNSKYSGETFWLAGLGSGCQQLSNHQWQALGVILYLEKEMATHSSILAWRIPWTEELGGLQSTGRK